MKTEEINLYSILKENKPIGMSDQEFINWYCGAIIKHTVILSKAHMENYNVAGSPKNTLKWAISHTEDNFEYVIKVKRFGKYSIGTVTNSIDNLLRRILNYFRTLDD